jgi:hypothetical protein
MLLTVDQAGVRRTCLVRAAERESLTRVFTLDRKHFSFYQPGRRRRFAIVP